MVGRSNGISREILLGTARSVTQNQPLPKGQRRCRGSAEGEVRAFIVAMKPGSINRRSEGRQGG
jgi:hypothetical protein